MRTIFHRLIGAKHGETRGTPKTPKIGKFGGVFSTPNLGRKPENPDFRQFSGFFGFFGQFRPISTKLDSPWGVGVPDAPASPSRRSTLGARSTIDDGCSLGTSPDNRPVMLLNENRIMKSYMLKTDGVAFEFIKKFPLCFRSALLSLKGGFLAIFEISKNLGL